MVRSDSNAAPSTSTVKGFSTRFNFFLDWARFPAESRFSRGAERFGVVYNTFRGWCSADKTPANYPALLALVKEVLDLVKHVAPDSLEYPRPDAIAAWLLAGDAVPNPFAETGSLRATLDLHFQISDIAAEQGIRFNELPRKTQQFILTQVQAMLPSAARRGAVSGQLDKAVVSKLRLILETVKGIGK